MHKPAKTERETYRHGNLRRESIELALALLEKGGSDAISLRKIAVDAGVTHRALYRHFADKSALLRAIAAQGFAALAERTKDAPDRQKFVEAYVRFAIERAHLYGLMMSRTNAEISKDAELGKAVSAVIGASKQALAPDKAGEEADQSVMRIWMLLHGGITLSQNSVLAPRSENELVAMLVKFADR